MKINQLPTEIQNRVFELQMQAGNTPNADLDLIAKKHEGNFNWHQSDEDYPFWGYINVGHFEEFRKKYGTSYPDPRIALADKIKKYVDDVIRDCPFTMSESNWDSLRDVMSIHLQKMLTK